MKSLPLVAAVGLWMAVTIPAASQSRRAPPPVTGETVILPDFTVQGRKELPPPESWLYGRLADGTEVLANASPRTTAQLLRDFQMFQQALAVAWPKLGTPPGLVARTLIVCGREDKFREFTAPTEAINETGTASRFLRNRDQAAIVINRQAQTLQLAALADDGPGAGVPSFEVDANKQLYREYVRFLLSGGRRPPPPWLQEGISQIVMAMEFAPDWIRLGGLDDQLGAPGATDLPIAAEGTDQPALVTVPDRAFNIALRQRSLIPLDQFFAVTADAPEANNPIGNNRWAKQAYAFVHLCLYGENGKYGAAFEAFTHRLETQAPSEGLFQECFKMSYRDMLFVLRSYVDVTAHRTDLFKLDAGSPRLGGVPVALRDATQAEVGRIKGDAQRLAGRMHDALASYSDAYARGERDPVLLASYGIAASQTGQAERALTLLETAVKGAGTRRPTAYVELGRQRLAAAKTKAGPAGLIDNATFAGVVEPLLQARSIGIPLPDTYTIIAQAWLVTLTPPRLQDFALLGEGVRQFPRELPLLQALARLYQRVGENAAARQLAEIGLRLASTSEDRAAFEQLLNSNPAK